MTKYICWSCGKAAKPKINNDSDMVETKPSEVYYLADCCRENSYPHLESIYPQPVQMELL